MNTDKNIGAAAPSSPSVLRPPSSVFGRRAASAISPPLSVLGRRPPVLGGFAAPLSPISYLLSSGAKRFSTLASRPSTGFTLIELLVVIAVIGILAGLTLAAMGGIQQRGARAKAETEVKTLSAAIEEFHRDFGKYPDTNSNALYNELVGTNAEINLSGKVYFEPTLGIVGTNTAGQRFFKDPWDRAYIYITNGDNLQNRGFFDLYSTANGKGEPIRN